jgi:hypothetical protein
MKKDERILVGDIVRYTGNENFEGVVIHTELDLFSGVTHVSVKNSNSQIMNTFTVSSGRWELVQTGYERELKELQESGLSAIQSWLSQ